MASIDTTAPEWPAPRTVYQVDGAGLYAGVTQADASPLEPGVWHMPAGCVLATPPLGWPTEFWPRWSGSDWELVPRPLIPDAQAKLAAFLAANPDVQALLG